MMKVEEMGTFPQRRQYGRMLDQVIVERCGTGLLGTDEQHFGQGAHMVRYQTKREPRKKRRHFQHSHSQQFSDTPREQHPRSTRNHGLKDAQS
jgi:hypothetical protein